jgi:hypothetical protein
MHTSYTFDPPKNCKPKPKIVTDYTLTFKNGYKLKWRYKAGWQRKLSGYLVMGSLKLGIVKDYHCTVANMDDILNWMREINWGWPKSTPDWY